MLFSIVAGLMVLLVAAFWAYQGLFSSALMFFETLVACMVAFGFYESVYDLYATSLNPGLGAPIAFMGLFLISLLLMRMMTDSIISSNLTLPVAVDRVGGGICGFFTGMILIGTALIGVQMLPIGSGVIGFQRWTTNPDGTVKRNGIFLRPDDFTAGLATMLSNGRFGGENPLSQAKPDFVDTLYSIRSDVQSESPIYLPADAIEVKGYWTTQQVDQVTHAAEGEKLSRSFTLVAPAKPTDTFLVCRVKVTSKAAPKDNPAVRFRLPQFRVVGPPPVAGEVAVAKKDPHVYMASAMTDIYTHKKLGVASVAPGQQTRLVRFSPQTDFILAPDVTKQVTTGSDYTVDVAFEVPDGFEPWYLEFKRGPRVELTKSLAKKEAPADAAMAHGDKNVVDLDEAARLAPKVGEAPKGQTHIANAKDEGTQANAELPLVLDKRDAMVSKSIQHGGLGEGRFWVEFSEKGIPSDAQIKQFYVPSEKRMIQVGTATLRAQSLFGRALQYANNVAGQISVTDDNGQKYYAIGQYAGIEKGGKWTFEMHYFPGYEVPERALSAQKFEKVTKSVLESVPEAQRKYGFLFLVEPGVHIVSFEAGKSGGQSLNLTAQD